MDHVIRGKPDPERQVWWALVFGLNLPVPLFFGCMVTGGGGRIGMCAGVVLLWYLGHRLCTMSDGVGRALVGGGSVIALLQLFPMAHIVVGLASVDLAGALTHEPVAGSDIHSELGGLIATGSMGLIMMTAAAFLGAIGSMMFSRRPPEESPVMSGLYDHQPDA